MNSRVRRAIILMAEDDPGDRLLARRAFEQTALPEALRFVEDGEELMDYLCCRGNYTDVDCAPRPDLVLLDLNMPRKDGREALREIRSDPKLRHIPVVVLTTTNASDEVLGSYRLGANSFIAKPANFEKFVEIARQLVRYWLDVVELPGK